MKVLKILGWIIVPYVMIFISWKKLGRIGKGFGVIWAVIALLLAIGNMTSDNTKTNPVTASVKQEQPKEDKSKSDADAQAKKEADAKAKAEAEAKAKEEANQPENVAKTVVHKVFGDKNSYDNKDSIVQLTFNKDNGNLFIAVFAHDNLTEKMIKEGMWMDVSNVLKSLKDNKDIKNISFNIVMPLQDAYGNSSNETVMKLTFSESTRSKINWDNFLWSNIPKIAEDYWEHPVVRKISVD
jgi:hypothetical protein